MTLLRFAKVSTPLGDDVLLFFSMDCTESLGQPFEYEVDLLSLDEQIDLTQLLGQMVVVTLELPDSQKREFSGIVRRFVQVGSLGNYVRYRATLMPWLWLMSRRSNCRIFQNKTVPEVVMAMFREHGFSDFEDALTGDYRTWEYLVQYRESDFNFVSRIMEQEGIYYYFKHADGKHTLVLSDAYSAHKPVPGYETVRYIAETDHTIEDRIDSWRAVREITSGAFAAADYDFEKPKAKLASTLLLYHYRPERADLRLPGRVRRHQASRRPGEGAVASRARAARHRLRRG